MHTCYLCAKLETIRYESLCNIIFNMLHGGMALSQRKLSRRLSCQEAKPFVGAVMAGVGYQGTPIQYETVVSTNQQS